MKAGFVYVMSNPLMAGIYKVGKSTRVPNERANELRSTGVPTDFIVEYYVFSEDHDNLELYVHEALDEYRVAQNREFFKVDLKSIVDTLDDTPYNISKVYPENIDHIKESSNRDLINQLKEKEKQSTDFIIKICESKGYSPASGEACCLLTLKTLRDYLPSLTRALGMGIVGVALISLWHGEEGEEGGAFPGKDGGKTSDGLLRPLDSIDRRGDVDRIRFSA